jgi:5-methylcytosine-specific restriction endonuclease McrA
MHNCLTCAATLTKKPGPGRWPHYCQEHRGGRTGKTRVDSARVAAKARWDMPGAREGASALARMAAEKRWANRTTRNCGCGHTVAVYEGHSRNKCDECVGLVCRDPNCETAVPRSKKWCEEHRIAAIRASRDVARDRAGTECSEMGCERPVRARTVCNMHYKRTLRKEGRLRADPWGERRRNDYHIRRARKMGTQSNGVVRVVDLIARDGLACGICQKAVDPNLAYPDPLSRSVDHIFPISRGGPHTPANCQLAHLRCNISKGARVV